MVNTFSGEEYDFEENFEEVEGGEVEMIEDKVCIDGEMTVLLSTSASSDMDTKEEAVESNQAAWKSILQDAPHGAVLQEEEMFSPKRGTGNVDRAEKGRAATTPPPSYDASIKKRRVVVARRKTPNHNTIRLGVATSPSRFVDEEREMMMVEEKVASAATPRAFFSIEPLLQENIARQQQQQQRSLLPRLQAKVITTKTVDPSPVKKRRIDEVEKKIFASSSFSATTSAATITSATTSTNSSHSTTSHSFAPQAATVLPSPPATSEKLFAAKPEFQFHQRGEVEAAAAAAAFGSTTHTTAHRTTNSSTASGSVAPLCATDAVYRTALEAFETSMSKDPDSHATMTALKSIVTLLRDSDIMLGDESLPCPELLLASAASIKEESKEETIERRAKEQVESELLEKMDRASKEREAMMDMFGATMIRWKISFGGSTKQKVVEEKAQEEENDAEVHDSLSETEH